MKQLNVALVGLGFGGAFAAIYKEHPLVGELTLCDPNADRLKQTNDAPLIVSSLSLPARLCHFLYGPDFAPLREREDYKALLAGLETMIMTENEKETEQ